MMTLECSLLGMIKQLLVCQVLATGITQQCLIISTIKLYYILVNIMDLSDLGYIQNNVESHMHLQPALEPSLCTAMT
jgi:hypothetical protein